MGERGLSFEPASLLIFELNPVHPAVPPWQGGSGGALPSCPSLFDGRGRGKLSMDLRACGCLLDLFVVLGTSDVV